MQPEKTKLPSDVTARAMQPSKTLLKGTLMVNSSSQDNIYTLQMYLIYNAKNTEILIDRHLVLILLQDCE